MTTLTITPNYGKKTAKFKGAIAAGEHVIVSIANDGTIEDTEHLRLRVVNQCDGKTLAQFPMPDSEDEWDDDTTPLKCELNLNTVQLIKSVPPATNMRFLFVLDDAESNTLYFKEYCEVQHWPRRIGEDEPVDLSGYKDFVSGMNSAIEELRNGTASNAIAISEEKALRQEGDTVLGRAVAHNATQIGQLLNGDYVREQVKVLFANHDYDLSTTEGFVEAFIDVVKTLGGEAHD